MTTFPKCWINVISYLEYKRLSSERTAMFFFPSLCYFTLATLNSFIHYCFSHVSWCLHSGIFKSSGEVCFVHERPSWQTYLKRWYWFHFCVLKPYTPTLLWPKYKIVSTFQQHFRRVCFEILKVFYACMEHSGSVEECFTQDRKAAGSSLTGVTALCPWERHINTCLVLVQPRKTRPDITERLLTGT